MARWFRGPKPIPRESLQGSSSGASAFPIGKTAAWLGGDGTLFHANLGYACARAGDRTRAERMLAALRSRSHNEYVSPVDVALVCRGLRDADGAMESLEEAYKTVAARTMIAGDPFFAELESDSRYRALLARLGLPLQLC